MYSVIKLSCISYFVAVVFFRTIVDTCYIFSGAQVTQHMELGERDAAITSFDINVPRRTKPIAEWPLYEVTVVQAN